MSRPSSDPPLGSRHFAMNEPLPVLWFQTWTLATLLSGARNVLSKSAVNWRTGGQFTPSMGWPPTELAKSGETVLDPYLPPLLMVPNWSW